MRLPLVRLRPRLHLLALVSLCVGPLSGQTAREAVAQDGYLEGAGGADLYYRVLGDGTDTVVVVHGGPGAGMGTILPHIRPLAERRTLVLYDQRGGGRSELPSDTTRLEAEYFVEDLEAVRRHFGLERMSVVAHSFGAVLVARYAQRYPERLRRIVFLGATGPERGQAGEAARAAYGSADTATVQRLMRVMRKLLSGGTADPVAACREYERLQGELSARPVDERTWEGTTCDAPPEAVEYYYRYTAQLTPRSFGDWDFTTGLEDLEAPLLVVHGARDTLGSPLQRAWADAVPNGRLLSVSDAGKGAIADRPEVVNGAIETFLEGRWPEGATPVGPGYGRANPDVPGQLSQYRQAGESQVVRDTAVRLNGRRIHALCTSGGVPGAVLLHGAGSRAETFRPLLERWDGESRLCAYDRRGHGGSGPAPAARGPAELLAELRAIHTALGYTRPVLVGHSRGALYARYLALKVPGEVAGLLLLDPGHEEMRAEVRGAMPESAWIAWGRALERNEDGIDQGVLAEELRRGVLPPGMPVTVITATRRRSDDGWDAESLDRAARKLHASLIDGLSRGRHVIFSGTGHNVHRDAPDRVLAELSRLLSIECPSRPPGSGRPRSDSPGPAPGRRSGSGRSR